MTFEKKICMIIIYLNVAYNEEAIHKWFQPIFPILGAPTSPCHLSKAPFSEDYLLPFQFGDSFMDSPLKPIDEQNKKCVNMNKQDYDTQNPEEPQGIPLKSVKPTNFEKLC